MNVRTKNSLARFSHIRTCFFGAICVNCIFISEAAGYSQLKEPGEFMCKVLGISALYHDSAAAILGNGRIIAAAQEERFTRKKHTSEFPRNAIAYCLEYSGFSLDELDAVVFYDKPFLKFERLLETYYAFAPRSLLQFLQAMPVWLREKLFIKKIIRDKLNEIEPLKHKNLRLLFPEHHLSHAASAFFPSPFEESAVLTIDGVGEWATSSISFGRDRDIVMMKEMKFPHSVGLLYSAFTYYLGFRVNSGEYKLMGLAPYGNPDAPQTQDFIRLIKTHMVSVKNDGSIWLNPDYFAYCSGLKMVRERKWRELFGFTRLKTFKDIKQKHCNLAYAIQQITEEIVVKMAIEARRVTGSEYLCMAGGVALNCVANGRIVREKIFKDVFIQPAAGDAGGALGAALVGHHMYFDQPRTAHSAGDAMQGSYLGPYFSDKETIRVFRKNKANFSKIQPFTELCEKVADLIDRGHVIGWFQDRMEFGPRALGNRSILADARSRDMQQTLNLKVKYRENFRPFAPSVLEECLHEFFELDRPSPYMLLTGYIHTDRRRELPRNFQELSVQEKIKFPKSDIPAVTHIDFSSRIQTVHKHTNPRFWQLLNTFRKKTGYGIILNTSFNVRGEPIVCTPQEAYECFMKTGMDYVVINDYLVSKPATNQA